MRSSADSLEGAARPFSLRERVSFSIPSLRGKVQNKAGSNGKQTDHDQQKIRVIVSSGSFFSLRVLRRAGRVLLDELSEMLTPDGGNRSTRSLDRLSGNAAYSQL